MPVRLSNSSVLKWPDAEAVDQATRRWATEMAKTHQGVRRIGYFGSYARGDAGVGSDIDLVIVLTDATLPFEKRASEWDATNLPVPADVLVYTEKEWESLRQRERFYQTLMRETVWILEREGENRK